MAISNFREDESLMDNLDDNEASKIFRALEEVEKKHPEQLDLFLCLTDILNTAVLDSANQNLIEEIVAKLEEKYVQN